MADIQIYQLGEKEEQNSSGDWEFIGTMIILRHGEDFFWDLSPRHQGRIVHSELRAKRIPTERLLPFLPDNTSLLLCSDFKTEKHYVKGPNAINYSAEATRVYGIRDLMLQEARICEILRSHPHPNIAQYHGCIQSGQWIVGLCFTHYDKTLRERLDDDSAGPLHKGKCFEGIKAGIRHLHELDLVHMDLTLDNVMVDDDDQPRIIDFDSCRKRGLELGIKHGDIEEGQVTAEFKSDNNALLRIREELGLNEV